MPFLTFNLFCRYDEDMALNDAAKLVPVAQWRESSEAGALVERLQLGLRRACCAAVASAPMDADRALAYERAGLAAYELVQAGYGVHSTVLVHRSIRWSMRWSIHLVHSLVHSFGPYHPTQSKPPTSTRIRFEGASLHQRLTRVGPDTCIAVKRAPLKSSE